MTKLHTVRFIYITSIKYMHLPHMCPQRRTLEAKIGQNLCYAKCSGNTQIYFGKALCRNLTFLTAKN
jgi:hypothetical protein